MYEIDAIVAKCPFLINDLFRHRHKRGKLKVFLCGKDPKGRPEDLRFQVRHWLKEQVGCDVLMGEDIDLPRLAKVGRDHLTIELKVAERCDLIIMFLQSRGTISELTAFAMNDSIRGKLAVFNNVRDKNEKSFINKGPLRRIGSDRTIWYNAEQGRPTWELVTQLDRIVGRAWFDNSYIDITAGAPDEFVAFVALATVYAAYPANWRDLVEFFPFDEHSLRSSLDFLFEHNLVRKEEKFHMPCKELQYLSISSACAADISRARTILMNYRLVSDEAIADYRLLLT